MGGLFSKRALSSYGSKLTLLIKVIHFYRNDLSERRGGGDVHWIIGLKGIIRMIREMYANKSQN